MTARDRGRAAAGRPRDLVKLGQSALAPLPALATFTDLPPEKRHQALDERRAELYEIAAVLADRAVRRARDNRHEFQPYGLVRSLFTQMRVVRLDPIAFEEGSITSFADLGKAYVDTLVFHLDRELAFVRQSGPRWLLTRLDALLDIFRASAGTEAAVVARMREPFSFLYGGLHFGASTCVQIAEAMNQLLVDGDGASLPIQEKVEVMRASVRVLHQLAALNLADVASVYQGLHDEEPRADWFDPAHFVVVVADGGAPRRIDLEAHALDRLSAKTPQESEPARFTTRGCPARYSPTGGPGAITVMWQWCIDLSQQTGLLAG